VAERLWFYLAVFVMGGVLTDRSIALSTGSCVSEAPSSYSAGPHIFARGFPYLMIDCLEV